MALYKKGTDLKLTANFRLSEFECNGKGCCGTTTIDKAFVKQLQEFRNYLGVRLGRTASISVTSGYRCKKHNAKVGGSSTSKHVRGLAADVMVKINGEYLSAKKVCAYAQDFGFDGIGYIGQFSTHLDARGYRWWVDETNGNKGTSDFYGYFALRREKNPYEPPSIPIRPGYRGNHVKWLQWILFNLHYYKGKISGVCNTETVNAIKAFQKDRDLEPDGICGNLTRRQLNIVW